MACCRRRWWSAGGHRPTARNSIAPPPAGCRRRSWPVPASGGDRRRGGASGPSGRLAEPRRFRVWCPGGWSPGPPGRRGGRGHLWMTLPALGPGSVAGERTGSGGYDDLSEQPVGLAVGPGGEDQFAGFGGVPVAEPEGPQAVDDDRVAARPAQLAQMGAGAGVVGVDVPVTEVADQQRPAESAEAGRCQGESPWRVELAMGHQTADEPALVGEDVPEALAHPL